MEALIFAGEEGASAEEIRQVLRESFGKDLALVEIAGLADKLAEEHGSDDRIFRLHLIDGRYRFLTKPVYHESINRLQAHRDRKKLGQSALETLAIIAYRQPITKIEVEQIRGVNCDYSVQRLLEKKLVRIAGKAETPGRPLLYATGDRFMDHFGINSAKDLPRLKDISAEENSIGEMTE